MALSLVFGASSCDVHPAHDYQQSQDQQPYYTHRLVEGVRTGSVVKQTTLLNLGSEFDVEQSDWPALAARIDALLHGQESLALEPLSEVVETLAQRCAAKLIALRPAPAEKPGASQAVAGAACGDGFPGGTKSRRDL